MSRAAAGLLVLSLAACAPARGGTAGPSPGGLALREAPAEVHGYRQTDFKRYEQASAGVSYRYGPGEPTLRDVYVYPLDRAVAAGGTAPISEARRESDNLKGVFEMYRAQRRVRSFDVLADSALVMPVPGGAVPGWHLAGRVVSGRGTEETHQHVFVVGDQFLKVRTTFPVGTASAATELDGFIRELLRLMVGPAGGSPLTGREG